MHGTVWFHLYETSRKGEPGETESTLVVAGAGGGGWGVGGSRNQVWGDEMSWN